MAKFSKKGWSSDTNYANFSAEGLERYVDKSRPIEELIARKDDFKKGENYHFHELLPAAADNRRTRPTPRAIAEPVAGKLPGTIGNRKTSH